MENPTINFVEVLNTLIIWAKESNSNLNIQDISDGFHSFNELYEFRKIFNAALFNEWAMTGKYQVHKSRRHPDGELCFGGDWFIVVAILPTGQISNHYKKEDWDLFSVEETEIPKVEYDNHTPTDVLHRLTSLYMK